MNRISFHCLGCPDPTDNLTFRERAIQFTENFSSTFNDDLDTNSTVGMFKIFEIEFDDMTFFRQLDVIFNIVRQKFTRLERCISKSDGVMNVEKSAKFAVYRAEVCSFLCRLQDFIKNWALRTDSISRQKTLLSSILKCLGTFILYVGQLRCVPIHILLNMPSKQGNLCQSIEYHFLHLHLDIRCYVLTLLFRLPSSFLETSSPNVLLPSCLFEKYNISVTSPFEQYVQLLIWDLLGIGAHLFHKISLSEFSLVSPFPCNCVRELWVLLMHLLDAQHIKEQKDAFWITMHGAFEIVLHFSAVPPMDDNVINMNDASAVKLVPDFSNLNRVGFCWWILLHVAPLYQILNPNSKSNQLQSNYFEIKNLCKLTIYSSESQLRCYMNCCVSICKTWEMSIETLLLLWEHFCKRINDDFRKDGETTSNLHKLSGLAWMKYIRSLVDDYEEMSESQNSYHVFLRLLAMEFKKSKQINSQREWKQMKGRIFAKFHPRKMLELNIMGLQNCFSLFLTLACIADLEDVVSKVCDLLELMDPSLLETGKYCIIWRAMFAYMLLAEEEQQDIGRPAQKMADDLSSLARLKENSPNEIQRHMAMELLTIYLEGLHDIFEHSANLNLSEYILIAPTFSELLAEANPDQLQIALTAIQVIMARHRMMLKKLIAENCSGESSGGAIERIHYEALADALWTHVRPLLNERTIGIVPHQLLANVATGFTLLMLDRPVMPSCPLQETFQNLVYYFGFSLQTGAQLCCQYLMNLLEQPNIIERIESEMPECQSSIIRAWFRLGIEIPNSADYHDLTRLVFDLPEMADIFKEAGYEPLPSKIEENAPRLFLEFLHQASMKKMRPNNYAFQQKVEVYLSDVLPLLNASLKTNLQLQTTQVVDVIGNILQTVSSLIYVKGKMDCLLNKLVTSLLLPPAIYNREKPVPAGFLSAMKANFHLFIEGISKLGFQRDPYLNRTLKDLFIHYLPRFPLKSIQSPGTQMHPIVVYVLSAVRKSEMDIFFFSIEVIKDHYLEKFPATDKLEMGLDFMTEVLERCTSNVQVAVCPTLLTSLLKLLLLLEDVKLKNSSLNLIKMLVGTTVTVEAENCRASLQLKLQDVIKQYIASYADKVFRLLGILMEYYSDVLGKLVPFIAEQLSSIEQKKGGGQDAGLRNKYKQFLSGLEMRHRH